MRILSVTAQKPDSTGSGVYLTELVKGFDKLGCDQAIICGTAPEDTLAFPAHIQVFPVYYSTPELPFPVCGMSDEMPYPSTRYRDMTENMTRKLMGAFRNTLHHAVESFRPDVILCHHLYFLAALIRQTYPDIPVYGQCHGSDLRQLATNSWQGDWIKGEIRKLDGIFALHEAQKIQICNTFGLSPERVNVVGTGYNSNVFYIDEIRKQQRCSSRLRLIFAGKLSEKKGLFSLLRSLHHLKNPESLEVYLAGGYGNPEEYEKLVNLAQQAPCPVTFLGKLDQKTLAQKLNESDVFILPSFYEGLPLVLIEAMACGLKVICTDLPGIQPWLNRAIPENGAVFVTPPEMRNADEPIPDQLPAFELRLARAIEEACCRPQADPDLVKKVSWDALCENLLKLWN